MRVTFHSILAVGAVAGFIPQALAWGGAGHEIVATIAQIHLHPSVLPKLCSILNFTSTNPNEPECHLAPIASWADRVRYLSQYRWTATLHYVEGKDDWPSERCEFPGKNGWVNGPKNNLLAGIRNTTGILEEWDGQEEEVGSPSNEALKFLVHFLGDLHQPLHLAARERGGNGIHVLFDGRHSTLHKVWDNNLLAQGLRSVPKNYSVPTPFPEIEFNLRGTIYDSYIRRVMWEGVMGRWRGDLEDWVSCPQDSNNGNSLTDANTSFVQTVLGMFRGNVADQTDDNVICPYHWAKPIEKLNCEFIFPKALDEPPYNKHATLSAKAEMEIAETNGRCSGDDGPYLELDTPEYSGKIQREFLMEKLLAQGGIRLAGILNYLFADFEDDDEACGMWVKTVEFM